MNRRVFVVAAACVITAVAVSAQVVPVDKEPHHRVRLDTILLRVLDINIPPGETTLDHRHERDIATVALADGATRARTAEQDWGAARGRASGSTNVTMYTGAAGAHLVENTATTPYHLIAVENNRAGGWLDTKPMTAQGASVVQQTRAFFAYDVTLPAGTRATNHPHEMPVVIVLMSGAVEISGNAGSEPSRVSQPGQWVLIPGGHNLGVVGSIDARVVEIEIR